MFSWFFPASHRSAPARTSRKPELEVLEDRTVPSVGSPFNISISTRDAGGPATASSDNGRSVVVWAEEDSSGQFDIFAQRYAFNHNPLGDVITVSDLDNNEFRPDVAMDAAGNFAVVWRRSLGFGTGDVLYALYSSSGNKITGGEMNGSAINPSSPQVAMKPSGSFVICYSVTDSDNRDVLAQRYRADGSAITVAGRADVGETLPRIDMANNGQFAIGYLRHVDSISTDRVAVARFAANGQLEDRHKITNISNSEDSSFDLGMANSGQCVVVYNSGGSGNFNISMRKLSAAGEVGASTLLSIHPDGETAPRLALDRGTGNFIVTFQRSESDGNHLILQEFFKDGTPITSRYEFGADTQSGSVSLDGIDRYFIAYEFEFNASDRDIKGAFDSLD